MVKSDLEEYMRILSKQRPVFHSEADFQLSLGVLLNKKFNVRLEVPYQNIPLNSGHKCPIKIELDILLKHGTQKIGVELKYKTEFGTFLINNESFNLKRHGAQNLGRFDFYDDVRRLQSLKAKGIIDKGYAIFLTNDHLYWTKAKRSNFSSQFSMSHGHIVMPNSSLTWLGEPSPGSVGAKRTGSALPVVIENEMRFNWIEYSGVDKDAFKYILVEV